MTSIERSADRTRSGDGRSPNGATAARQSNLERGRRSERRTRTLAIGALISSAAVTGLAIVWLTTPESSPFATTATATSLADTLLDAAAAALLALVVGVTGIALGTALTIRPDLARRLVVGSAAAVLALAFAFLFGSMSTIAIAGYLFGALAVVAGPVTILVLLWRAPRLGSALLVLLLALLAVAFMWAGLTVDAVTGFAVNTGRALVAGSGVFSLVGLGLVSTLLWSAIAIIVLRSVGSGRFEAWLVRHRRSITLLAAAGPLPYLVARASWLTPWPLFGPSSDDLDPATLATGLVLGGGAAAACLLTLGLILPWGRVFPRWMPRIGGRSVPVAVAAVPGFTAAGILCVAAVPMLMTTVGPADSPADALLVNLVLPLWFWGPMLALAVSAYVAWRARDGVSSAARAGTRSAL
ncbi:hypothetical protein [Agromyces subbeticus]|uniref:hypothetical protein n=1 Tax=Agromyces subbeticus TaxID=293890 RepID=UPI0003B670D4|nr:hypothetical protein [Agromyces subbeticus]